MHELPLHPLTVTNLLMKPVEAVMLPVAEMGMDVEKVIKDPGFAQWVVYLLVAIWVIKEVGGGLLRMMGVSLPVKRDISGTLTTKPEKQHADQNEVNELKAALQALREENRTQHNQAATAGANRVAALSEVVDSETASLSQKIDAVQDKLLEKIEEGFSGIHEKLNAVAIQAARHDEALPHLTERIAALTVRHNEAIPNIHRRIDELTRSMASKTR